MHRSSPHSTFIDWTPSSPIVASAVVVWFPFGQQRQLPLYRVRQTQLGTPRPSTTAQHRPTAQPPGPDLTCTCSCWTPSYRPVRLSTSIPQSPNPPLKQCPGTDRVPSSILILTDRRPHERTHLASCGRRQRSHPPPFSERSSWTTALPLPHRGRRST